MENTGVFGSVGSAVLIRLFLISLFSSSIVGCSSLSRSDEFRVMAIKDYLSQTEPLVLYATSPLQADEQLRLFGLNHQVESLNRFISAAHAVRDLIVRTVSMTPVFNEMTVRVVEPEQWGAIERSMTTPVLFVYADWRLVYQRLPPNMQRFRLQAGVIAKVIPLGQVVSGKGTLALRTAAWEARCLHDALSGRYFSVAEWRADGARQLHLAVTEVQEVCGEKFAREFQGAT